MRVVEEVSSRTNIGKVHLTGQPDARSGVAPAPPLNQHHSLSKMDDRSFFKSCIGILAQFDPNIKRSQEIFDSVIDEYSSFMTEFKLWCIQSNGSTRIYSKGFYSKLPISIDKVGPFFDDIKLKIEYLKRIFSELTKG